MRALHFEGGFFLLAGGLLVFAGAVFWQAIESWRESERLRATLWASATVAAIVAAGALMWFWSAHPDFDLWTRRDFGPGWRCENLGDVAADVCERETPPSR
jgi:hypothetical protein